MRGVLLWVLSGILFLTAVACAVFGILARDREELYLAWAAWAVWILLCLALGLVLKAALLWRSTFYRRAHQTHKWRWEEQLVAEELDTYTPNGPAPLVTPDGSAKLTSRRPGRELFPSSWLRHKAEVTYEGGSMSGLLLEFCSSGLIVQAGGSKRLVSWDALQVVELVEG